MSLAVLNPGGRDPEQHFPDFAGAPDEAAHPPVNYHAFAACTGGAFHRKDQAIPAETKNVLLLLRRDLKASRDALLELRRAGKTVIVALKEAGAFQVAELLGKPARLRLCQEICRRGVFIGTREFSTPSRNHLAALLAVRQLAEAMQEPVTVFNGDGWRGRRMLARLQLPDSLLRVIENRLPYPRYLRLLARHRIVWQLDASAVPGQVAGDALLCRVPCVGGNGTTERLVFPDLCGHGRTAEQLFDLAARLLDHPHDVQVVIERAVELARESLSFAVVAKQLQAVFARLAR